MHRGWCGSDDLTHTHTHPQTYTGEGVALVSSSLTHIHTHTHDRGWCSFGELLPHGTGMGWGCVGILRLQRLPQQLQS